jgi:hypothetical protein
MYEIELPQRPKTHVQWILGNRCNYKCSYCHEMFRMGDRAFLTEEALLETCKDIIYHYDDLGRDVVFEFIGGEPTLFGRISEIGKRLSNHPTNIVLKTNGSADLDWWRESKPFLGKVIISAHKEFCDIDHLMRVVELLQDDTDSYPTPVEVLFPVTNRTESWNWGMKNLRLFRSKYGVGDIQLLYSNFARGSNMFLPYRKEMWDEYNQLYNIKPEVISPTPVVMRDQPIFTGRRCYAGIDTLTIDADGNVRRGWCGEDGLVGNIYELPVAWPTDPIICQKAICGNGFDQQARKESI